MSGAFDDEVVEVGTEGCLKNSEGLEEGGGVGEGVVTAVGLLEVSTLHFD